ncbi:hypothetical protein B566_EDAN015473 [Ephemera danica]|nr:hypothetical protein B566_EDAN015473 [Ephemera danica]
MEANPEISKKCSQHRVLWLVVAQLDVGDTVGGELATVLGVGGGEEIASSSTSVTITPPFLSLPSDSEGDSSFSWRFSTSALKFSMSC